MNFGFGQSFNLSRFKRSVSPVLFEYHAGDDVTAMGGTFSRSSSATYTDSDGAIKTVPSHVIRDSHYINSKRYTLLEGQRTRLAMPEVYGWTNQAESNVSTIVDILPSGETGEFANVSLGDASDNADHGVYTPVDIPSTGAYTLSVWVRGGFGEKVYLYNFQSHQRILIEFEGVETWQRVQITATHDTGQIYPVFDTHDRLNGTDNLPSVSFYAAWPTMEAGSFSSNTIVSTFGASASRAADSLSFPFPYPPQEMSVFIRGVDLGTCISPQFTRYMQTGAQSPDNPPRMAIYSEGTGQASLQHYNGAVSTATAGAIGIGDSVEILASLGGDGSTSIGVSINGGVASNGSGPFIAVGAAWASEHIAIGGSGAGSNGFFAFRDIIIARGTLNFNWFRSRIDA